MNGIIKLIYIYLKQIYMIFWKNHIYGISIFRRFCNFKIMGTNNTIVVKSHLPINVDIVIYGDNHKLIIEEDVVFKKGQIWFEDHDCEICIESGTTIEEAHLAVAENGTKILIGKDCMFSKGIHIATTDSHSVISLESGQRINPSQNIVIGNHVWLGYCVNINKGVVIEPDCIVASHSVVTKTIKSHSIAAGIPAKVVKSNITWNRISI